MEACSRWKQTFVCFSQDIRLEIFLRFLRNKAANNPLGPISEIYTTEWFHILSVFSVTTCSAFCWGLISVRPYCSTQIFLTSITGQETKPFSSFPHHFMELYYHLTMVTCLSSPFNQTSSAEEEVLLDFYMSARLSRIAKHAVKGNSGSYGSLLLSQQKV